MDDVSLKATNADVLSASADTPQTGLQVAANTSAGGGPSDSHDLVFELDETAQCQWVNEQVKAVFGDVRGKHIDEIFSDQPEVLQQYQRIAGGHEFIYFEVPKQHSWVIQGVRTSTGKFSGSVITGQITTEQSQLTPPLAPSAWSYDITTNELRVSDAAAAVFGFPSNRLNLNNAISVLPEPMMMLRECCRGLFLRDAEFFLKEFQLLDNTMKPRWLSIRGQIANIDEQQHVTRLNGSIEDITERVEDLKNRQDLELKMLRVQKMEAIGELAGGISHDFNNILTSVMGYTELALMEAMPDSNAKIATYLQEIYQGGRRARELVAKMLTFSRTDQVQPQNFGLMQEVKDIVKMLRASLPSSIEIRIDIDEGLPEVFIDKNFLQQMIMNICINSRDAMIDGGTIYIRGRSRLVRKDYCDSCHTEFVGDFVELSIEDTGCGISESIMGRLFEPYVSTKADGSGMGLAMVHGIMHRQGGHIKVDSIEQDGTEIRVFLKPADNYGVTTPMSPYTDIELPDGSSEKHILVIDDEVSLVYFLRELLQKRGYEVTVASDSHEAWDLFSAASDKYDLVITDQTMPGMSGVQLAAKMLTLRDDLPIILCTGYSDVVDESNISQYGIQGYMAKPIDTKELLQSVKELLAANDRKKLN